MSDLIFSLVATWGPGLLFLVTFLSCLALPVPSSLMMAAGGAFAASGEFSLWISAGAALSGAILGDQTGYALGRRGAAQLNKNRSGKTSRLLKRAKTLLEGRAGVGIFLSRWLFSPLGPYVNFLAGATGTPWQTFTVWGTAGELVWVTVYTALGYLFFNRLAELTELLGDFSGLATALLIMVLAGTRLWRAIRTKAHD